MNTQSHASKHELRSSSEPARQGRQRDEYADHLDLWLPVLRPSQTRTCSQTLLASSLAQPIVACHPSHRRCCHRLLISSHPIPPSLPQSLPPSLHPSHLVAEAHQLSRPRARLPIINRGPGLQHPPLIPPSPLTLSSRYALTMHTYYLLYFKYYLTKLDPSIQRSADSWQVPILAVALHRARSGTSRCPRRMTVSGCCAACEAYLQLAHASFPVRLRIVLKTAHVAQLAAELLKC